MRLRQKILGKAICPDTRSLRPIREYHLANNGGYELKISELGATITEVSVPCKQTDQIRPVAVSFPELSFYTNLATNPFMLGSTMGRYARSVENARFTLDGNEYTLDANQGPHHFHGGLTGFDKVFWQGEEKGGADFPQVEFSLERPDGDQGYPGSVVVTARFTLMDDGFSVEYSAKTNRPTIFGLCNHVFWNLTRNQSANHQLLQLNSSSVIVNDAMGIPIGNPIPLDGSDLDFRTLRPLEGTSLDNCFPLTSGAPACTLVDPETRLRLVVHTNMPAIAVFVAEIEAAKTDGVCLQLTEWPNAPNRPDFPSVILRPQDEYYNFTRYIFDSM